MEIIEKLNANWMLASEIHKLEARLWRRSRRDDLRVILFTSPSRGDGKSTTVAYMAAALGQHSTRRVLAVDLDFRQPTLNLHFGLKVEKSAGMVLAGECSPDEAILETGLPNLQLVLPFGEGEDPALLFRTPELTSAIAHYRAHYDLVLLDVPALLPVADAALVLPVADAVVLLAMAGKTTRQELSRAREICLGMEANILGLVVTNLQEALPEQRGSYGYGYGYGYGPAPGRGQGTRSRGDAASAAGNGTEKGPAADAGDDGRESGANNGNGRVQAAAHGNGASPADEAAAGRAGEGRAPVAAGTGGRHAGGFVEPDGSDVTTKS